MSIAESERPTQVYDRLNQEFLKRHESAEPFSPAHKVLWDIGEEREAEEEYYHWRGAIKEKGPESDFLAELIRSSQKLEIVRGRIGQRSSEIPGYFSSRKQILSELLIIETAELKMFSEIKASDHRRVHSDSGRMTMEIAKKLSAEMP